MIDNFVPLLWCWYTNVCQPRSGTPCLLWPPQEPCCQPFYLNPDFCKYNCSFLEMFRPHGLGVRYPAETTFGRNFYGRIRIRNFGGLAETETGSETYRSCLADGRTGLSANRVPVYRIRVSATIRASGMWFGSGLSGIISAITFQGL